MKKITCIVVALLIVGAFPALAKKPPKVSHDGLELQKDTKLRYVYLKPGENLSQYSKIALLDPAVQFRKGWQDDYNRTTADPGARISDKEAAAIKDRVAKEFMAVFQRELEKKGGYEIVDYADKDVLVLRPAIVNLEVNAPETMSAGRSRTFTSTAGQMTLYLEFFDSISSEILARVVDPQAAPESGLVVATRASNKAEADRILTRWAGILRGHLDAVHKVGSE